MHRYQPRLHVLYNSSNGKADASVHKFQEFKTFVFPETQFTAVTAYQNHRVGKIQYPVVLELKLGSRKGARRVSFSALTPLALTHGRSE